MFSAKMHAGYYRRLAPHLALAEPVLPCLLLLLPMLIKASPMFAYTRRSHFTVQASPEVPRLSAV